MTFLTTVRIDVTVKELHQTNLLRTLAVKLEPHTRPPGLPIDRIEIDFERTHHGSLKPPVFTFQLVETHGILPKCGFRNKTAMALWRNLDMSRTGHFGGRAGHHTLRCAC